jgi:hypothetical protein
MTHTILTAEATQRIEEALENLVGMGEAEKALAIIRAARAQEDKVCGFSLLLDRESWGHILDGLMLERERSEQRKSANPESNSNYIADRCAELIIQIGEAACVPMHHPDDEAVDRFAAAMKAKLAKKRADGRGGWEDKNRCSAEFLNELLNDHIIKGDPLDVGNLAMMLWSRGEPTTAKVTETSGVEWVTTFTPLRSGSENFLQIEDKCLAPKASVPEFTAEQKDQFARAFDAAFAKAGLPQKQPEKTNTQLMEGYRIGLAEMREKCARLCENRLDYYGVGSAHGLVIEKLAAAIRAIKFEGDTGFRPVSEMIAEEEPVNTRSTSEYSEPVKQEPVAIVDVLALAKELGHPCPEADAAFLEDLAKNIAAPLQAQIDRLMLEYCPDEMTPGQLTNWAAHQKAFIETPAALQQMNTPDKEGMGT